MKTILQTLLMAMTLSLTAQSYQFGIVSDYNNTANPYEFTFVTTPNFDNSDPNMADMQITLAITSGNSIAAGSFTELFGTGWQVNTALTGSVLQGNFGIGDGTKDLWIFSLPVPSSELTTPHTTGVGIPVLSFIVDNMPTSGEIEILENNDPIALALAGFGFVVDNVINADLNDGNGTQDYYGKTDTANNNFIFSSLSIGEVIDNTLELSLYPNPAKDVVTVRGDINRLESVEIYSLSGQLIKTVTRDFNEISISELETSVYIMRLYGEDASIQTLRLIKR
ncbi:T9SS type A sorting domain-containing protein [Winogradskyella sp. 3972H.M.0a.05]|uniref:T9SS type A sorting domain-containing protein n=1 Tax=Winogradskyella sp. 3972H.M.0a.05 TaxID=2950277 RepID=UPI003390EA76